MNAPLNRDQQIALMRDADVRIEKQAKVWVKNPQIRASLLRKSGAERYSLELSEPVKTRRCG